MWRTATYRWTSWWCKNRMMVQKYDDPLIGTTQVQCVFCLLCVFMYSLLLPNFTCQKCLPVPAACMASKVSFYRQLSVRSRNQKLLYRQLHTKCLMRAQWDWGGLTTAGPVLSLRYVCFQAAPCTWWVIFVAVHNTAQAHECSIYIRHTGAHIHTHINTCDFFCIFLTAAYLPSILQLSKAMTASYTASRSFL